MSDEARLEDAGAAALAELDKVLAEKPRKDGHDFSDTTRRLCTLRDQAIAAWRVSGTESDRRRMARINGVISAVLGGHFPLGPVPWPLVEAARRELAALVGEGESVPVGD
jgi:hypothetical protein